jgi:VanZ family protein
MRVATLVGHFVVYGALATTLAGGFRCRGSRPRTAFAFGVALAIAYGVTDEIHQSFVPGRRADPADVLADALGALIIAGLASRLYDPVVASIRRWMLPEASRRP